MIERVKIPPVPGNPFRDRSMRDRFDACVYCYNTQHRDLIRVYPDHIARCYGNSIAGMFWKGYDGERRDHYHGDRDFKRTLGYACYRAGEHCRKLDGEQPRYPKAERRW